MNEHGQFIDESARIDGYRPPLAIETSGSTTSIPSTTAN